MQMIQCAKGHFYDPEKEPACPYCTGKAQFAERPIPLTQTAAPSAPLPQTRPAAVESFPATVPVSDAPLPPTEPLRPPEGDGTAGIAPVLGWLVCLNGPRRGRDFRVNVERCFIGRTQSNDISLSWDNSLQRDSHVVIYYNKEKNTFWLDVSQSKENICINGDLVFAQVPLGDRDVITVGETQLMFCAFCRDALSWRKDG